MKCPSKEIDKNNISLLLPNHNFSIVSLNLNIRCVCFFWLSCGVFAVHGGLMCLCRGKQGGWGTLRSVLRDLCLSSSVWPGWEAVSLFLSDTGPRRAHITNPLLYSNLLQARLLYCLARPGSVWTERVSSGYTVLQPQNHQWLVLASQSVHPSFLAVDSHLRSTWYTTAPLTSSGSALGSV